MRVGAESEDSGWDLAERYLGRLVDVAASRSTLRTARDYIPRPCEDVPAMAEVNRGSRQSIDRSGNDPAPGAPVTAGPFDLPPEPPALVNLLVHDGSPSEDALPATVLDLAARGVVHLEETAPGECLCRLRPRSNSEGLLPYERRVLSLLRSRAIGGTVPADALTVGVQDETDAWWKAFADEVTADSRERGYLQPTWWTRGLAPLALTGVIAVLGALLYSWGSDSTTGRAAYGVGFAAVFVASMFIDDPGKGRRLTRSGRQARGRWIAAEHALGWSEALRDDPPPSVAIWRRHLAYGAALGVAPAACRGLPIGPESSHVVWVQRGGLWRRARVKYARRFPPGLGRPPWVAFAIGAAGTAVAGLILALAARPGAWYPNPPFAPEIAEALGDAEPIIVGVASVVVVLSIWELVTALLDVGARATTVTGPVVARWMHQGRRINPWRDLVPSRRYIAVDTGDADVIRSWRVPEDEFWAVRRGDIVTVTVDRRLRHVRKVDILER